jgi:class 3 adenylate cyclase/tetratricopeptide (TPR) repeat protein
LSEFGVPASSQEAADRRFLTIEFIDLVGSTDLAERLDPEDLGPLLRRYHRLALSIMERFGGFVAQVFGDGILVYFGYPTAHEHEAERALRAALALLQQLRTLDTNVHGKTLPRLEARIGIHSGLVVIAQALQVSAGVSRHDVVGEAINLAARLETEAAPGGIAISRETMELVEGLFAFRSLGVKSLKGLSRKIEVYEVLRALPGTKRTEIRLRRGATRLVGRESAIERILSCWNAVKDGSRCQTLAIVGDAGVGKTRLMLELCGRPEFVDATLWQSQCHEMFASTPLYPLGALLSARAGLTADDEESVRYEKISSYLEELGRNTAENRGLVAALLGMSIPAGSAEAAATPELLKRAQFEFVVSIVKQAASARPVIVWTEDAHWRDPSSAELLQDIVTACAQLPVLVVSTRRPFPKGPALPNADVTVHLDHLELADCLELARSIPGASALSDEMISKAIAAADGVPFFLEQLVISLIEEQSQGPAPYRRLGGVPLMLAELLSERLDRRPGARRIAQAAACIGRSFTPEFLLKLLPDEAGQVQERLEALVEAEILLPRRHGVEVRYEFRHALLQRMAHESMLHAERRLMHRRVVDVLSEATGGEPTIPEAVAYHLTEAGAVDEAIAAWLWAGTSATRRSAHVEAIEHIRSGLALLDQIPDPGSRRRLEESLQVSLMGSLLATQSATSAELSACCERGLQLCTESSSTAMMFPFAFGQFTFVNCRGRGSEAIALATQFISHAEREGFESERVIGHRMLGQALLATGESAAAKPELERSLALYVHERDAAATHMYGQNTEVHTKSLLSLTQLCLGDVDAALEAGLDALHTADALRHPHSTAIPMVYVGGWVFGLCEATEQMMTQARNLLALAEQHRLYGFRAHAAAFVGWALCQGGNPGQGIPMIAQAIAAFDSVQFRLAEAGHLSNLAEAQHRVGRLTDAAATCDRAIELMAEGSRWLEPELRRVQAVIAADLAPADRQGADALFRCAITCAQQSRAPVFERRCLVSFQRFLESTGRHDADVESRLGELSHLSNLAQRVADAIQAKPPRVPQGRAALL